MSDPDYERWLEQEAHFEQIDELLEDLPPSQRHLPGEPPFALLLSVAERNRIAASLALTAAVQVALGENAGALESTLLAAKVREGLQEVD